MIKKVSERMLVDKAIDILIAAKTFTSCEYEREKDAMDILEQQAKTMVSLLRSFRKDQAI